ncbi:hypothetical protein HHI36_004312 [Cryptolaemus montrouzieri]|uniref:Uncharacterized protein n=1 Tax=Cryptolaemus montrouzieri TaxID=559131 RepID=A0ABD2NQT0_9CUCU
MEQVELSISILGSSVKEETQICVICGSNHNAEDCTYLSITNHILDKEVPTKARLSLPDELMIQALADGTNRIITKKFISKGTRFGPIEALNSFSLNPSIQFPLKVFPYEEEDF